MLFKRKREERTFSIGSTDPTFIRLMGGYGPTLSGVTVTEGSALTSMAVWHAVRTTAGVVAGMPLKVYKDRPSGLREELSPPLFMDPMYPEVTWFEGIETLVASQLLWGNGYALKIYNEAGSQVARVLPLPPDSVSVRRVEPYHGNPSGKLFRVSGMEQELTPFEVMHLPGLSFDGITGLNPVAYAREAIGAGIAAERVASKMFDSGLLAGGILQADGPMNDDQAEEAKRRWREKTSGVVNSYEVALLSHGWKFMPTQLPPKDAQWLEARQFSVAEIARMFGMPPAVLFEYANTGNVEADKLGAQWLRFGLNHLLTRVEKRLSLHLLPEGEFCEFVREGLLQGTPGEQADVVAKEIGSGVLTIDEARSLKNLPPLEVDAGESSLLEKVNAATALIRAGFDPNAAMAACGLPPVAHLGLLPITLQKEEVFDAEADAAEKEVDGGSGDADLSDSESDDSEESGE